MLNCDYVYRLYAYNALDYFFSDFASVQTYVLPSLTEQQQSTIYQDPKYGMNTITGLTEWMKAADNTAPTTSAKANEIVAYFSTLGINLTQSQLTICIANGSMMKQILAQVKYSILNAPVLELNSRSDILTDTLPSQWGFSGVTSTPYINLAGVTPIYSVAQLNLDFAYAPEFGAFVLDPSRANSTMSNTLDKRASEKDFSRDVTDFRSFLNL